VLTTNSRVGCRKSIRSLHRTAILKGMRIHAVERLGSFFQERLRAALAQRSVRLEGALQVYLVDLLERYAAAHPQRALRPLVDHLTDALEAPTPLDRLRLYREMGDAALCVSGLFGEHLSARGISRRYVASMGGFAYRHASHLASVPGSRSTASAHVYHQLAHRFDEIAGLLVDVGEATDMRTPQDVVRLYERWRRTHSPVLAARLREEGVFPQAPGDRTVH
jgi:hypothetical protein